jgi:transcriptional regulator with XRE-family HTH domain
MSPIEPPSDKHPRAPRARRTRFSAREVARLRGDLGLPLKDFARLTGFSERAVASWEAGSPVSPPVRRRLLELDRLFRSLAELVKDGTIPEWLQTPNPAFGGLKPLEVIERGEVDRLWRMIYYLESGMPV